MRQCLLVAALLLAPLATGWALGNPEAGDYKPVQGLENWDARLDIAGMKAGKYNLIVRGTDAAGNVRYQGPYNVFVDPNSDLPVVHISHPTAGARVGTLLHVVGTCLDDDGVKSVMVQLDEQDPVPAVGTEFWSFALDVAAVQDGEHVLTAKGIDINGAEGRAQSVRFQIDKKAPAIRITSHPSGAVVTGQVTLDGEVEDANGVASLAVSRDGGKSWEPLKPSLDKPGHKGAFRVGLDTRKISDGPQVLSFKAVDRTGSISQFAFLLFVNNDAPVLEILSPTDDAVVNGKVMVSGRASDKIGLKSLQYDLGGGEAGTIVLAAGNPFWTQELDLSAKKAGALQVTYTLENLTGNRQIRKLKLKVDPEKDRPLLTVSTPAKGERVTGPVMVSGFVRDDDAVERIEYSLDGGSPASLPAVSAFSFALGELAPGAHKVVLKAVDVNGLAGLPVETAFTKAGPPPSIVVDGLVTATGSVSFAPGIVFPGDKDAKLTGTVRFSGASLQAEYGLQGATAKSLALKNGSTPDQKLLEVPLPKGLAAGRAEIAIKATDGFGGVSEYRSFLFVGAEQGESGIILVDSRLTTEGIIRLEERPLAGYVTGGAIQKAELEPPTDLVRVDIEGPVFRVTSTAAGTSAPTRIKITAAGGSAFATEPIRFITDFTPPEIVVETPRLGDWLSKEMVLKGSVSDAGSAAEAGGVLLEYSLDGGTFTPMETKAEAKGAAFGSTLPFGTLDDGPHLLALRATDKAGNAALSQIPFLRDSIAPGIVFVAPRAQDEVNGLVTIVGRIEDAGDVERVEVTEDGKSWREVGRQAAFRFDVNLSLLGGNTEALQVRCTDAAGNAGLARPQLTLNLAADVPIVQIQLPADGELLRNDFVMSGMAFDDDGVKAISWRIDGGDFQPLPGGNNFSVPISLDQVTDNEHTVEVKAEDIGGLMSEVAKSRFKISRSDPISSLESPGIADHVRGVVELKGTSSDPNGIAGVRISFDNGLSFYRAEGAESWRYRLDTRLLADGTQAVLVRATDATGAEGLFTSTINIDNSAPELVVDSPSDGQVVSDTLRLGGRSVDSIGLASLAVSVAPISAAAGAGGAEGAVRAEAKSLAATLSPGGILAQDIDIRDMAPGWYNVQIEAADKAGNRSYVSRNFLRRASQEAERVELFFPAAGERLAGPFAVSGQVVTRTALSGKNAVILVDGQPLATAPMNSQGYFHLDVDPSAIATGDHALSVEVVLGEGVRLLSEPRTLQYAKEGPWVSVGSFAPGDYVTGRPFLKGNAGWLAGDTAAATADASAAEAASAEGAGKDAGAKKAKDPKVPAERKVRLVEVSMDNGTSFSKAEGTDSWRYRLESVQLANGVLRLLVKATFAGGATAVTRTQLIVDTRAPEVTLMEPKEGGRFNESVPVMGTASDESGLKEVAVSLREGDKSRYQVPSFIQGLYVDAHTMGATYWDAGLGLSFFDSNVKLQLQIGMSPPGRFSGFVIGAKLLANIATLPFGYILGPSWDFFSMALAIGANFSYFTMSENSIAFSGAGLVLGGVVGQLEFAKFRIPGWRVLNNWSLYTEYQLWFISSDVQGGVVNKVAFGMRVGLL